MDTGFINVSAVSSANQWAEYDAALQALYEPYLKRDFQRTQSVNLVDWMWPSRHRGHEIGCCIDMLREIGITVNTVISGGISIQEIEKSMTAGVNAVVCSSVMGENAGQAGQKGNHFGRAACALWLFWNAGMAEQHCPDAGNGSQVRHRRYTP